MTKVLLVFLLIVFIGIAEEIAMPKFISGDGNVDDFSDSGDTETQQVSCKEISDTEKVSFDLDKAELNTFVANKSNWHLLFSRKMITKSEFYFGTAECGIASLRIIIGMESGDVYELQRDCTDLGFQQVFSIPVVSGKIKSVSVVVVNESDCFSEYDVRELNDSEAFRVLSANTIKAKKTVTLLCLDKYCNVLDAISIKKGKKYLINTDTHYYEVIMEDT